MCGPLARETAHARGAPHDPAAHFLRARQPRRVQDLLAPVAPLHRLPERVDHAPLPRAARCRGGGHLLGAGPRPRRTRRPGGDHRATSGACGDPHGASRSVRAVDARARNARAGCTSGRWRGDQGPAKATPRRAPVASPVGRRRGRAGLLDERRDFVTASPQLGREAHLQVVAAGLRLRGGSHDGGANLRAVKCGRDRRHRDAMRLRAEPHHARQDRIRRHPGILAPPAAAAGAPCRDRPLGRATPLPMARAGFPGLE